MFCSTMFFNILELYDLSMQDRILVYIFLQIVYRSKFISFFLKIVTSSERIKNWFHICTYFMFFYTQNIDKHIINWRVASLAK